MAARIAAEVCEVLWIRAQIRNAGIHHAARTFCEFGKARLPPHSAWRFEHEAQTLLDEILELAAAQRRLRLGPAVELIRYFDRRFHLALHKTINPYLQVADWIASGGPGHHR